MRAWTRRRGSNLDRPAPWTRGGALAPGPVPRNRGADRFAAGPWPRAGDHVDICYNPRLTLMKTIGVLALCALAAFAGPFDKKKKKSEQDVTQVLQLPKDPPSAVVAETARLGFYVSPLSSRGLLSQQ